MEFSHLLKEGGTQCSNYESGISLLTFCHTNKTIPSDLSLFPSFGHRLVSPSQSFIINTTVSRFFTDKSSGAVPQDPGRSSEESPSTTTPINKRHSLLQRLHIHSTSKKPKPKPPTLTIRPTTSSSLPAHPVRSSSQVRAGSSHSNAATIAEIAHIMPQSLHTGTLPQASNKRQRSRDSRNDAASSRPDSAGQSGNAGTLSDTEGLTRKGVKMPAYLNKTRNGRTVSLF